MQQGAIFGSDFAKRQLAANDDANQRKEKCTAAGDDDNVEAGGDVDVLRAIGADPALDAHAARRHVRRVRAFGRHLALRVVLALATDRIGIEKILHIRRHQLASASQRRRIGVFRSKPVGTVSLFKIKQHNQRSTVGAESSKRHVPGQR
jgi:hypothetical protein